MAEDDLPVTAGVMSWVMDLKQLASAVQKSQTKRTTVSKVRLFYEIGPEGRPGIAGVTLLKGSRPEIAKHWQNVDRALLQPPGFVDETDMPILRLLWAGRNLYNSRFPFTVPLEKGAELLEKLVATGRLLAGPPDRLPIAEGPTRPANVVWQPDSVGRQVPQIISKPLADLIVPTDPPWYVDFEAGQAGPIEIDASPTILRKLLSLPPLSAREAWLVAETLAEVAPEVPAPKDDINEGLRVIDSQPVPVLRLDSLQVDGIRHWREYTPRYGSVYFDFAQPSLRYGEVSLPFGSDQEYAPSASGEVVRVIRQQLREAELLRELSLCELQPVPASAMYCYGERPRDMYGLAAAEDWEYFVSQVLPVLRERGWQIEFAPNFRHHYLEVDAWEADVGENDNGWFDLDMGIVVEGRRLALAPLLADLLKRDERWLDPFMLANIPDAEWIDLLTPEEQRIRVPAQRLKPLARILIDLFDSYSGSGKIKVSKLDAPRLAELYDKTRWQFRGMDAVMELAERLRASQGVKTVEPPKGFALNLRPYQLEGVAWLQFLREHGLAGILADDMGLGKTAQTLAHLLLEKEQGRLTKPALIVLPTSLIYNWRQEAARFAPSLSVLNLHGAARKSLFEEIPRHDLVLTTYPLLWRDADDLSAFDYYALILDEAQTVKNAQSRSARVVRRLKADHRLCLTGTPLENHLGELWAQFDFLLPGFLGELREFTRYWRSPIEKQGDVARRELLAKRLRPFILRRRKEEVARELPPKTVILRTVELAGGQRDLYETVRAAMDSKIREEIASKGFKRSQIVILDALLKLRQVCCDPRLVKSNAAKRVKERAKLDQLMDMLPELVDEGRRILLFSQFTSMLDLIEDELREAKLDFVRLSGDTVDRETPVRRFQNAEVPIFLISLKAGGVGLNLTAADTVIHYDPWWNPAVENQATDRAHRLGQDKPVFVYKLIVAGSIEERILALQDRKAALAAGILSDDHTVDLKFGEDDLSALFAPLPE